MVSSQIVTGSNALGIVAKEQRWNEKNYPIFLLILFKKILSIEETD